MLMLQKLHHGRSYLKANQLYWDWCQNWAWVQRQGWICCAFWEFWSRSVVWCFTVPGTWSPSLCFGWCTSHSTKYIHCYHTMIIIKKKNCRGNAHCFKNYQVLWISIVKRISIVKSKHRKKNYVKKYECCYWWGGGGHVDFKRKSL